MRHIWVCQCGVHGLQWGAGRRWGKSVEDNTTRNEICLHSTKYFLVKWYLNSFFDWMDATSISAGSFASCLLFWFYFLMFGLTGNSSKMEHVEINYGSSLFTFPTWFDNMINSWTSRKVRTLLQWLRFMLVKVLVHALLRIRHGYWTPKWCRNITIDGLTFSFGSKFSKPTVIWHVISWCI